MDERERSTEDIRQDIAREEEKLSRTAHQIGDRIKEKLNWSEYVKDSPYWALGIAAGIGFFAARGLQKRTTPMQRIIGSLAEEVRGSLGGLHIEAPRPSLAHVTLVAIGTKLAHEWMKNANPTSGSSSCVKSPSQAEGGATVYPHATGKNHQNINTLGEYHG